MRNPALRKPASLRLMSRGRPLAPSLAFTVFTVSPSRADRAPAFRRKAAPEGFSLENFGAIEAYFGHMDLQTGKPMRPFPTGSILIPSRP